MKRDLGIRIEGSRWPNACSTTAPREELLEAAEKLKNEPVGLTRDRLIPEGAEPGQIHRKVDKLFIDLMCRLLSEGVKPWVVAGCAQDAARHSAKWASMTRVERDELLRE